MNWTKTALSASRPMAFATVILVALVLAATLTVDVSRAYAVSSLEAGVQADSPSTHVSTMAGTYTLRKTSGYYSCANKKAVMRIKGDKLYIKGSLTRYKNLMGMAKEKAKKTYKGYSVFRLSNKAVYDYDEQYTLHPEVSKSYFKKKCNGKKAYYTVIVKDGKATYVTNLFHW